MKKIIRKIQLALLVVFVISVSGFLGSYAYKKDIEIAYQPEIATYKKSEGTFLVASKISVSSPDYVAVEKIYYEQPPFKKYPYKETGDYHTLEVYKPSHGGKVYKTFDLLKIAQAYYPSFIPSYSMSRRDEKILKLYRKQSTGETYFSFPVINSHLGNTAFYSNAQADMIYVNIETGEVVYTSAGLGSLKADDNPELTVFDAAVEGLSERLSRLDVNFFAETKKGAYIIAETYHGTLEGSKLANNYPELIAAAQPKDEDQHRGYADAYIYLSGKDAYAKLAKLLAQEGQEDIFDGLTLKAANSKDGQNHKLSSYADLLKYYKEN